MFKEKLEDYTEEEFLNFLGGLRSTMKDGKPLKGKELEMYWDSLVDHFIEITQHPSGSDLIFGNDSNLLIVFYVQIMPDDFVMQLHRF